MRIASVYKVLGVLTGAVVGVLIALALTIYFLVNSGCVNQILAEAGSPTGKFKAVVFQRDCGATTGLSTQISVIESSSTLGNVSGNVFTSDTDHGAASWGPGGGPEVKVHWREPQLLVVSHHAAARVFKAERKVSSVKVHYEQLSQ